MPSFVVAAVVVVVAFVAAAVVFARSWLVVECLVVVDNKEVCASYSGGDIFSDLPSLRDSQNKGR